MSPQTTPAQLPVGQIGFGAMRITGQGIWGPPRDESEAIALLRRVVDRGVTFIDTADSYGPGISEMLIAKALYPYPAGLVVATKGGLTRPGADRWVADCRPEHLRRACADSLRRLRLERIELYQLHAVDHRIPIEDSGQCARRPFGMSGENPRFCRNHPPYRATALANPPQLSAA